MWQQFRGQLNAHAHHVVNVASFVGTRLLAIIAFALSVPYFIRTSSEAEYGVVAIAFSLFALSSLFEVSIAYVVTQSQGRKLARSLQPTDGALNGLFCFYLYSAVAFSAVLALCIALSGMAVRESILFMSLSLSLPALVISGLVAACFQARNELHLINLSRFAFELGKALALAASAFFSASHVLVGPLLLAVLWGRATHDLSTLRKRTGLAFRPLPLAKLPRYRRFAGLGLPSLGIVSLTLTVTVLDKLFIKWWGAPADVAFYSVAFDVNVKAFLLVNAVNMALFTVILRRFSIKSSVRMPVSVGLLAVGFVTCLYYIPMFFYSEKLISFLVSPRFAAESARMASTMSIASVIYLVGNVFENAATAMGGAKHIFLVYLCATLAYFAALPILAREYGAHGFVLAYVIFCMILCAGFVGVYLRKAASIK